MSSIEDMKKRRTNAQREVTKRVNKIDDSLDLFSADELVNEQRALTACYNTFWGITDDYINALEEDDGTDHSKEVADVKGKLENCRKRYRDTMQQLKDSLWRENVTSQFDKLKVRLDEDFAKAKQLEQTEITTHQFDDMYGRLDTSVTELEGLRDRYAAFIPKDESAALRVRCKDDERALKEVTRTLRRQIRDVGEGSDGHVDAHDSDLSVKFTRASSPTDQVSTDQPRKAKLPPMPSLQDLNEEQDARLRGLSSGSDDRRGSGGSGVMQGTIGPTVGAVAPRLKLAPLELPKFTGVRRNFFSWKEKWIKLQSMAEPSGSPELLLFHLLDSVDKAVKNELRLDYCRNANDVFRALEDRYGDVSLIADDIVMELQEMQAVRGNNPRETLQLIQKVERALDDLTDIQCPGAINNPLVVRALEKKLPHDLQTRWLVFQCDPANRITALNRFDGLLNFLRDQKTVLIRQEQLLSKRPDNTKVGEPQSRNKSSSDKPQERRASTKTTVSGEKSSASQDPCVACGDKGHTGHLYRCKTFRQSSVADKRALAKKAKVCFKCLDPHDGSCKRNFLCKNEECKRGEAPSDHHYMLCFKARPSSDTVPKDNAKGGVAKGGSKGDSKRNPRGPTVEQEALFAEANLTEEQLAIIRRAITNKASSTVCADSGRPKENPVLLMLLEVTTTRGDWVGTLIDLASDTNYVTHQAAKRLGLEGVPVTLVVHGVGGMVTKVETKKYSVGLKVEMKKGALHTYNLICYGLDEIAKVGYTVDSERLEGFFPDEVQPGDLRRPRKVEMLISAREGRLAPKWMGRCGDLVLWDGPLGKTVSGAHPDLVEDVEKSALTHIAWSMRAEAVRVEVPQGCPVQDSTTCTACNAEIMKWMEWDSIGAACDPMCGGCRCGKCPPGGKEMSLADERELAIIKRGLTFKLCDEHSDKPHWDASYPWKEDPSTLPNNRKAVEATFLKSEARLARDPAWKEAYAKQIHDMLERGAAVKLSKAEMDKWDGAVWWINHLVAPNPHSVSTPVRIVWDSSQEFRGVSMNGILLKGPDVLNPIRAVLLRFREGAHAAIGDISKMYNSVWLEEQEVHVHRFLWRDSTDDEIQDHAVVRVNMGDRPSGCIAQVAMRETACLPQFIDMVDEKDVIIDNSYVDDLFASNNDSKRLSEILVGVETILATGGFHLKPWVQSGQSGRGGVEPTRQETILLPNQMREEDNKALGVGYHVEEDQLFLMVAINFSARKRKLRTELDLTVEEVEDKTPNPLTRRMLLSQVAGLYDPIGLATPLKQKGVILVRRAFQEAGSLTKDTWDEPLSDELRRRAIELFKDYARLSSVTFPRCITPPGWVGKPWGITFSDGSSESYGAVLYFRWETASGVETRLVESKAKLAPLDQKGDAVKAEVCGAVFATRLKRFVLKHGRVEVEKWFHFVDSQTVLGAIQKDSYGFQTFFANRIGEIQKAGPMTDWWWIPGALNVADLVTRGCSPEMLDGDSLWQRGPGFLSMPVEEWPMKSAAEVAAESRETVSTLRKKAFSAVVTRAQLKRQGSSNDGGNAASISDGGSSVVDVVVPTPNAAAGSLATAPDDGTQKLWGAALVSQMDLARSTTLSALCGVVGYVRRSLHIWLHVRAGHQVQRSKVLSVKEREAAFQDLCLAAQAGVSFPTTTLNRLVVSKDNVTGLLLCHGRIQSVAEESPGVPLIPYGERISILLAEEAHNANHEGVAGTLLRMRKKAWVVQAPRIARKVVDACLHCRKKKARFNTQVMGDLPTVRTSPAAPFEYTTLDLFGPYTVRDMVKRRTKKKVWGVVFSCMASRAIHADLVDDLSTEGFLQTYQRFTALRGHPRKLWSDRGTNFVGARPALEDLYRFLAVIDQDVVQRKAAVAGTDWAWEFSPADSPHRNGAAEAAVGVLKRALSSVGENEDLSTLEFQTLLYLAANLSNERPIGARTQVQEETVDIITPNSLLLGRAGPKGDAQGFDFPAYPFSRLRAVQVEVDKFWRRWSQLAGPHLFVRQKWHVPARNVAVGDLVWVADQNALRGRFQLGRVVEVFPDGQGVVRDVRVRTCPTLPISWSEVKKKGGLSWPSTILHRDVRRLVVLIPIEDQQ